MNNYKNLMDKTVFGVGYIGEGKYNRKDYSKIYDTWTDMLRRCYDPYSINKELSYIDCYVCKLWHCFQNFAKWYEENYYECGNEVMQLDKDILIKGNKVYSPETCVFVPQRINKLFTKNNRRRGKYPIGINKHTKNNCLVVQCSIFKNNKKENKYLGCFSIDKPFQAFTCYKQFKENYIKEVADEYKDLIPNELYEAMYRWEVEIND